jgi:hypothetical protein
LSVTIIGEGKLILDKLNAWRHSPVICTRVDVGTLETRYARGRAEERLVRQYGIEDVEMNN